MASIAVQSPPAETKEEGIRKNSKRVAAPAVAQLDNMKPQSRRSSATTNTSSPTDDPITTNDQQQTTTTTVAPTRTVDSSTPEEFDENGNVLRVANLEFVQGILGKGAYGTVRLAKRRAVDTSSTTASSSMHPSTSTASSSDEDMTAMTPGRRHRYRTSRRMRGEGYYRSSSAPVTSAFFSGTDEKHHKHRVSFGGRRSSSNEDLPDREDSTSEGKRHHQQQRKASLPTDDRPSPSSTTPTAAAALDFVRRASSTLSSFFDDHASQQQQDNTTTLVAVKICSKSILKRMRTMERDSKTHKLKVKTALEKVEREIALMKKMRHPNLVRLFEVIDSPSSNTLYMVLEYMPLGEILTYQDDGTFRRKPRAEGEPNLEGVNKYGYFDEPHAALYFVDILHALAYLHQHHICHRDLKPENILLDARGIVKITDFGVSHFFEKEHGTVGAQRVDNRRDSDDEGGGSSSGEFAFKQYQRLTRSDTDSALKMAGMHNAGLLTKTEGTWCFWSPEMCSTTSGGAFSGYAADLWAAGVCLYIFVTGRLPFFSEIPTDLFDMIAKADVPYQGHGLSNALIDLLKSTLEKDPAKRAGVGDCLKHPFLQVAREKRIRQLSAELERSDKRKLVVGDDDIRKAFSIVSMPVALLKSAQKQLKETYQFARDRMSSMYSHSSQSSFDMDELSPQARPAGASNPTLTKRHSTMSSSSSTESNKVQPQKLFTIPHDRKVTESTREATSISLSASFDSEAAKSSATDERGLDEMESAALSSVAASPVASASTPTGASTGKKTKKKSKAKKQANARAQTKRRKGSCTIM